MIQRTWKCPVIHLFVIAIFLFVPTTSFQSSSFSMQLMKPRTSNNSNNSISISSSRLSHCSRNGHDSPITAPILKIASTMKKTELKAEAVGVADADENNKKQKVPFPIVIWRFTRPHTLIGSALAIPALHIFAAPTFQEAFRLKTAISAIYAMVPSLLMNLYITGLNQITDVEIDKINKPNLPIAAGDLSTKTATIVVTISLILSLALGLSNPNLGTQGLNIALWGSMVLGTMYSLQPFRLKRFPLLAAFCIVAVRGTIINAGFYAHAKAAAFSSSTAVANGVGVTFLSCMADQRCFLSSLFFAIFGIVIALMKDVPDAVGDALFNIRSFTVRIGQKRVFKTMTKVLACLFFGVGIGFTNGAIQALRMSSSLLDAGVGVGVGVGTTVTSGMSLGICRSIVAFSAFAAAISVRKEAKVVVDPEDSGMVYKYYMHLWKLFYLSYLVLPFAR